MLVALWRQRLLQSLRGCNPELVFHLSCVRLRAVLRGYMIHSAPAHLNLTKDAAHFVPLWALSTRLREVLAQGSSVDYIYYDVLCTMYLYIVLCTCT